MVNPNNVKGRGIVYFRADPNKMKRGSGYYYKRSDSDFRSNKAKGKNYFSKYSITRDYLNKPNRKDRKVVYKKVGGLQKKANLTDDVTKAGKTLVRKTASIMKDENKGNYNKEIEQRAVIMANRETMSYKEKSKKYKSKSKKYKSKRR